MDDKTPALGKTADGHAIVDGLVVFTNEMRVGVVRTGRHPYSPGWFDVEYPGGGCVMQNGERVATRFEGRSAEAEWNRKSGAARYEPEDSEY